MCERRTDMLSSVIMLVFLSFALAGAFIWANTERVWAEKKVKALETELKGGR